MACSTVNFLTQLYKLHRSWIGLYTTVSGPASVAPVHMPKVWDILNSGYVTHLGKYFFHNSVAYVIQY
jgi:hypothetical protein